MWDKTENEKVIRLQHDAEALEQFISENESRILRYASAATKRYVCKQDDEWSVALRAFLEAVETYQCEKGSFDLFSKLVIKRRLIDYTRSTHKTDCEISVDPSIFDFDSEQDNTETVGLRNQIAPEVIRTTDHRASEEISAIAGVLREYGFDFFDLADCSPKSRKTKTACAKAVRILLNSSDSVRAMRRTKMLPIKILQENSNLPRKLFERHRKYIIAVVEILLGDYPILAEYLQFIGKDLEQ